MHFGSISSPKPLCNECVTVFNWSNCTRLFAHVPEHQQQLIASSHFSHKLSSFESGQFEPQDIGHSLCGGRISVHSSGAHRRRRLYLHFLSGDTDQVSTLCLPELSDTKEYTPNHTYTGTQTVVWLACSMAQFLLFWTA